jgi:hypothetical protein
MSASKHSFHVALLSIETPDGSAHANGEVSTNGNFRQYVAGKVADGPHSRASCFGMHQPRFAAPLDRRTSQLMPSGG